MKKIIMLMALMIGLFFGNTTFAEGFEGMDVIMSISPPKQKIILAPGETYEGSIKVSNSNESKKDLKYSVTIGSLSYVKDENGNTDFNNTDTETITSYNQIMQWIKLGKTEGTVSPNSYDVIPFTINVPNDAPSGGQYATIIIQNDTKDEAPTSNGLFIKNVIRFASSIFAEVSGKTREEGTIIDNTIPAFLFNNTLSATSTVRNSGNVHADASYILQVWPLFSDEEICTNEEEPSESLIMPDTERLHVEECKLPPIGIFRAKQTIKIFGETSVVEKTIIVCPLWLLFIIIFVIILIIMWIVIRAKNRKQTTKA